MEAQGSNKMAMLSLRVNPISPTSNSFASLSQHGSLIHLPVSSTFSNSSAVATIHLLSSSASGDSIGSKVAISQYVASSRA